MLTWEDPGSKFHIRLDNGGEYVPLAFDRFDVGIYRVTSYNAGH